VALTLAACGASGGTTSATRASPAAPVVTTDGAATTTADGAATTAADGAATTTAAPVVARRPTPPFAIADQVLTFVDHSRTVSYRGEAPQPRKLVTIVRYPRARGPFPLVVFGHGFAVTPAPYARLLQAWAGAGYVVAAPVFPLGNANAPGGPNEADLVNQPRDMSFVITRMLALSGARGGPLAGMIAPREIAVAGQSDGGDTALSAAYNSRFHDRRIRAAVILSGQEIPGVGGYDFPPPSPPLLATQGLADTINLPATTFAFFDAAPAPKYLLTMPGAPHLPPYTYQEPQLGIVERVTTAFLDRYLEGQPGALTRMKAAGHVPGLASLQGDPG
jgi:dienelactone hydrolase